MKFICIALLFFITSVYADIDKLEKAIKAQYPDIKIQGISKTQFNDLYEVYLGNQIIYTDKSFKFLIVDGHLVDPKTKKDLTADRLSELQRIPFENLPKDLAIKIKKGNGLKKVAVFSDIDCPFCRKLEKDVLMKLDDIEIYTFIFPLAIHPEAEEKSLKIWCSDNPSKNWINFMTNAQLPANDANCVSPVKQIQDFALKHGIQSTPTIIFQNGNRVSGAIPLEEFKSLM
ncbi:MAG: DsbC family protein [Alphaproteobacteria bacterium]|jgi:thiol:disulfide interchange protein DsbC